MEFDPESAAKDHAFMDGDEARPLRIAFFGSARQNEDGPMARYYADARELARALTEWSRTLGCPKERFEVCTGGGGGFMEEANRGAMVRPFGFKARPIGKRSSTSTPWCGTA